MYHVKLSETHYEAGYRWGRNLLDHGVQIKGSPTFELTEEKQWFSSKCEEEYRRYFPEILEEIQGIADGQNIPYPLLCTIIFSIYCFQPQNKCTCFTIAERGNVIFGRNSDFLVSLEKFNLNCIYRLKESYAFQANTTAFVQMEDGVNQRGFAAGLTFVYPHVRKPGFNAGMLLRYLLEKCGSTAEAIEALKSLPVASAQTLTLADRQGEIAVVECNPNDMAVVRPEPGEPFVVTANNFNAKEMRQYRNPEIDDWRSDERYKTAYTALKNHSGQYTIEFAQSLLAGKYGFMCQYDRKQNADTVWSVVYDLTEGCIYRAEGNPSRKRFQLDTRFQFAGETRPLSNKDGTEDKK